MLSLLHIENIAVIEAADIAFDGQLNLLTGETGAGKSIVIDAINALCGRRASRELIRAGKECAEVSGVFFGVPDGARRFVEAAGYPCGEELTVSRVMQNDGRNICRLDGKPASVSVLRGLGEFLIDIHGQQDTGALLREERHLDFLDSFGEIDRAGYAAAYAHYKTLERERQALRRDDEDKRRQAEQLEERLDEIAALDPRQGETDQLSARCKTLRAAGRIRQALDTAYAALYGDEDTPGACELCETAAGAMADAARHAPEAEGLSGRLRELRFSLSDGADDIRALKNRMEDSEAELEQVEGRLDALRKAERRYNMTAEALAEVAGRWRLELEALSGAEERLRELETLCEKALAEVTRHGEKLHKKRTAAAKALGTRMMDELSDLDMQKVRFVAELSPVPLGANGADGCAFLLSANPGEPPKPLAKIASGGELARIMLALKNILSEGEDVPTLIFDEVDAGVSGRAAQRVARKLRAVSRRKQVLCVTHLPQIAAMADTHFFIQKGVRNGRACTDVQKLSHKERVEELARLLSGDNITNPARKNAEELLKQLTINNEQ